MSLPENNDQHDATASKVGSTKRLSRVGEGSVSLPIGAENTKKESKSNVSRGAKDDSKPPIPGNQKLSNAELKKRAKAGKAAKRAQEKEAKASSQPALPDVKAHDAPPDGSHTRSPSDSVAAPSTKSQHKQSGPSPKSLPLRSTQAQPKKEIKNVALFGHLYGQPRRTTIAAAGKDVHPAILSLGLQMSNYIICGSNARCVATMLCFKRVIESYVTPPQNSLPRHLTSHLSPQIDYLVSCRPLSVSMGNAIRWLKLEINDVDPATPEAEAKTGLGRAIDNFIRDRITVADQVITASAADKIQPGDVILTFAKSSIVQQTLLEAHHRQQQQRQQQQQRRGRPSPSFRVIVVDSRPLLEGRSLTRALVAAGLDVAYRHIDALAHCTRDATKVFLGAHAMMSNGRLYSRLGTALVAMMAKDADLPVIVCCESIKFTDKVALDSVVLNEVAPPDELLLQPRGGGGGGIESGSGSGGGGSGLGLGSPTALRRWRDCPRLQLLHLMYDVTPAEYVDMVVTEYGSLPPSAVPVVYRLSNEVLPGGK